MDNIIVNVNSSSPFNNMGQVYVFAQSNGETRFVAKSNSQASMFRVAIPKNKFPSGIAQVTLFSAAGEPLNERIFFIQQSIAQLNLKIGTGTTNGTIRQKMKIDLDVQSSDGKPVKGYFAASVIDENKIPVSNIAETNILSQLLLKSDLRGYVEQPDYYFTDISKDTEASLDLLMLTQGYRRFEWKSLLAGTTETAKFPVEKLTNVSGTITIDKKPVPNAKVTLFTNSGSLFLLDSLADANGHFAFRNMFLRDSVRFVLKAQTPKGDKNVTITLDDNQQSDKLIPQIPMPESANSKQLLTYLAADKELFNTETQFGIGDHAIALNQVNITGGEKATIKKALPTSNNLNGAGNADQVLGPDYFSKATCSTVEQCLQGLVGVIFRNGVPYSTRTTSLTDAPMLVIFNGVREQTGFLATLSVQELGSVEVLRSIAYTAMYGSEGGNGILIITSKTGPDQIADTYKPGIVNFSPKGYYAVRTFYSPQYDNPKENTKIADLRSTIYWKPNIITDQNGHASFEYFNAGSPGTYRVTIEGIDAAGNLGHKVYKYKVDQ
jgi:hypothetical protein